MRHNFLAKLGRLLPVVLVLLVLAGCATTAAQSTAQRWEQVWAKRTATYSSDAQQLKGQVNEQYHDYIQFVAHNPSAGKESGERLLHLANLWANLAQVQGKQATLARFSELKQSRPTWGIVSTWFQDQAQQLLSLDRKTDERFKAFLNASKDTSRPYPNWFQDAKTVIWERGLATGAIDELMRLFREVKAFQSDMQTAATQDRIQRERTTAALLAIGNSLQQYNYQQQLLNQINRPRTCTQVGASVTCY